MSGGLGDMRCEFTDICTSVSKLVEKLSKRNDTIQTCTKSGPCFELLSRLQYIGEAISPASVETVLEYIGAYLPDPGVYSLEDVKPFKCTEIDLDIYVPCTVSSCMFHTMNRWTGNCIIRYIYSQNKQDLDVNEIRFLLGITQAQFRRITNSAITKLQKLALRKAASDAAADTVKIYDTGCSVCGNTGNIYKLTDGFVYCSQSCFKHKRPSELRLESEFGIPTKKLLEIAITSFHGKRKLNNALGLNSAELRALLEKHNITPPDFISSTS